MWAILARDEKLQPRLTGHVYICTGFLHDYTDQNGNVLRLFPEQFRSASRSWEMYKDGPVSNRAMNDFYAGTLPFRSLLKDLLTHVSKTLQDVTLPLHCSPRFLRRTFQDWAPSTSRSQGWTYGKTVRYSTAIWSNGPVVRPKSTFTQECHTCGIQYIPSCRSTRNGLKI